MEKRNADGSITIDQVGLKKLAEMLISMLVEHDMVHYEIAGRLYKIKGFRVGKEIAGDPPGYIFSSEKQESEDPSWI